MNAPIDVRNIIIKTERLVLRPFSELDLNDFFEYASVDGVGECAGWSHHKSIDESKDILKMFIEGHKTLAITYQDKVIGSLGLEEINLIYEEKYPELKGREIGYVLSKNYWCNGFMTEAVKSIIDYCFDVLGFDFLTCGHFIENNRSRRVVEKCGFIYDADVLYHTRMGEEKKSKMYILFNNKK